MALKSINKFGTANQEKDSLAEIFKSRESKNRESQEAGFEIPQEKSRAEVSPETVNVASQAPVPDEPSLASSHLVAPKSENLLKIEAILEEDLSEVYFKMDSVRRQKFKLEGERVSVKIDQLLQKTKDETKNIFKLIIKWLRMIPGSNKFFIEQEAKIKTDKILRLKK